MKRKSLTSSFSMNRAEESSLDMWGEYVLPIYYKEYNLLQNEKSTHITGGRGIGKTAYLLYHCYPTILSSKKTEIKDEELEKIGLYLKLDSELLEDMTSAVLDKNWIHAFNAYIGLSIFIELSKFLKTFLDSSYVNEEIKIKVREILLAKRVVSFLGIDKDILFIDYEKEGHLLRSEFIDWLCSPEKELPFKFKAKEKIEYFIKLIKEVEIFSNTKFHIFIDEFEHFNEEQQQVINSWIKHVPENTIYNVAYKKYYEPTVSTIGSESIQPRNDYREVNIEFDLIGEKNFKLIASEIIINKVQTVFDDVYADLKDYDLNYLSNEKFIELRKKDEYRNKIDNIINEMFPDISLKEVSKLILNDTLLRGKVITSIKDGLGKNSDFKVEQFIDDEKPEESILNAILLHRKRINASILLDNFTNNIEEYAKWKNNNLFGAIIYIYNKEKINRRCPYYGGFKHFIEQSALNIRHTLELVLQCFIYAEKQDNSFQKLQDITINIEYQANVVREVSRNEFDRKIAYLGTYGKKLKKIAERLGKLFELAHNNPAQSFAEVNLFALISSAEEAKLSSEEITDYELLLRELLMWSVVTERDNTKKWNSSQNNSLKEYRLHPMLSSYFGISFRKKRKYDFNYAEIKTIFLGTDKEYQELHKKYAEKNNNENDNPEEITLLDMIK